MTANPITIARSPVHERSISVFAWYVVAIVAYTALCTMLAPEAAPLSNIVLAAVMAAICLLPITLWYAQRRSTVPMFELIAISYLVQYGMPALVEPNSVVANSTLVTFSWADTQRAQIEVALSAICLIGAYYSLRATGLADRLPRVDLVLRSGERRQYIVAAVVAGYVLTIIISLLGLSRVTGIDSIYQVLKTQEFIAIVLVSIEVFSGRYNTAKWRLTLCVLVALAAIEGLESGFLEQAATPFVLLLICKWAVTRRLPKAPLLIGVALLLLLNFVKHDYRAVAWNGSVRPDPITSVELWVENSAATVGTLAQGNVTANVVTMARESATRFDVLHIYQLIEHDTPSTVPYFHGSSYTYFLYTWVPRVIWPSKPTSSAPDTAVTIAYGLAYTGSKSSIGVGQFGLGYANFGLIGALLVMALQGLVFAAFDTVFNSETSDGGRAIYIALMVVFLNGVGAGAATLFGNLIQTAFADGVIMRLFMRYYDPGTRKSQGRRVLARTARSRSQRLPLTDVGIRRF